MTKEEQNAKVEEMDALMTEALLQKLRQGDVKGSTLAVVLNYLKFKECPTEGQVSPEQAREYLEGLELPFPGNE